MTCREFCKEYNCFKFLGSLTNEGGRISLVRTKQRGVPTLGGRVTSLMEAAQLNASELSARTGISVSYMTRIIQGEVINPTIDFIIRIAAGLGVTESELLREDEEDKDAGRGKKTNHKAAGHGQVLKSKPRPISTLMPTVAHTGKALPYVPVSTVGEQIERLLASSRLSEEDEKKIATALIEITKHLLALTTQREKREED
jgi:transcriptional regulator with XRE-family HTH domain